MRTRKATIAAITAITAAIVPSLAAPAVAGSERMQLACASGTLAGHTLERTNGSSWWDVADATVYTTSSIVVTHEGDVVHEHQYGAKAAVPDTCVGDHHGFTWDLELVRSAPR